jgi:hypothetical protein
MRKSWANAAAPAVKDATIANARNVHAVRDRINGMRMRPGRWGRHTVGAFD